MNDSSSDLMLKADFLVGHSQRAVAQRVLMKALEEGYITLPQFEARTSEVAVAETLADLWIATERIPNVHKNPLFLEPQRESPPFWQDLLISLAPVFLFLGLLYLISWLLF